MSGLRDLAKAESVEAAGRAMIEHMRQGEVTTKTDLPFRPSSIRGEEGRLEQYVFPGLGDLRVDEVDAPRVQALMDGLLAEGASSSVVRSVAVALRRLFSCLVDVGRVLENPAAELELPAVRPRTPVVVPPQEALQRIECLTGPTRVAWALVFLGGLRREELFSLRIADLDLDFGALIVRRVWNWHSRRHVPAEGARRRQVPVPGVLRVELERAVSALPWADGLLLGANPDWPSSPSVIYSAANRTWKRDGMSRLLIRDARSSWMTYLAYAGVSPHRIRELAGHAGLSSTFAWIGEIWPAEGDDEVAAALQRFVLRPEPTLARAPEGELERLELGFRGFGDPERDR